MIACLRQFIILPTVKEQIETNAIDQLPFSFLFIPVTQSMEWCCPKIKISLFTLISLISIIHHRNVQRLIYHLVITDAFKLGKFITWICFTDIFTLLLTEFFKFLHFLLITFIASV